MFENRKFMFVFTILVSIALTLVFGALFALTGKNFEESFLKCCKISFLWFFAPGVVSAALILVTKISMDLVYGFGAGLYYGTIVISAIIRKIEIKEYIIGAIISSLIAYIVWIKNFKEE